MVQGIGVLVVLTAGCGTTLRAVEPAKAAKLLGPHHVPLVREACDGCLRYADQARRILVDRLDFEDRRAVCDAGGPYELVLILDPDDRVERYRLLRVRSMRGRRCTAVLLIVIVVSPGCVPVPFVVPVLPLGYTVDGKPISKDVIAFLRPGTTSKAEVVWELGAPDDAGTGDDDDWISYTNWRHRGGVIGGVVVVIVTPMGVSSEEAEESRISAGDRGSSRSGSTRPVS